MFEGNRVSICDPSRHFGQAGGDIARAVAIRFMSGNRFEKWHHALFGPEAAESYAAAMARLGVSVRLYDVAVDLAHGETRVSPHAGWTPEANQPGGEDRPETEFDRNEMAIAGHATLMRSPSGWRIFIVDTERDFAVDADNPEHDSRKSAMAWLRAWANKPIGCSAIAVGPGSGPVTITRLQLWAHSWVVWRADRRQPSTADTPWICSRSEAKSIAKEIDREGDCAVIITSYKTEGDR